MDSFTHIALGACIGEAVAGKYLGKRALLLGALAQSVPDVDFITAIWQTESQHLLSHRGFTHSIVFAVLSIALLTVLSVRFFRKIEIPVQRFIWLYAINVFAHIFLDTLNAYGTGLLEPFSDRRFSFNMIFVADPLFSIGPLIACIALSFVKNDAWKIRRLWWKTGIILSGIYLAYATTNKIKTDNRVKDTIKEAGIQDGEYLTTPSPFNSILWFVVIKHDSGFNVGYHSVLDGDKKLALTYFPKNEQLLQQVQNKEEVEHLKKFAGTFYTAEQWNDTIVFNTLRFGQIVGWHDPYEKFVFHYYLDKPGANHLVTQRGRFKRWNDTTVHSLWRRIKGS